MYTQGFHHASTMRKDGAQLSMLVPPKTMHSSQHLSSPKGLQVDVVETSTQTAGGLMVWTSDLN
jgi:ketol-acid reductoisomerase